MKGTLAAWTMLTVLALSAGCSRNSFDKDHAIRLQKELLDSRQQYEIELEALRQKGSTALQELLNKERLEQLRIGDSLQAAATVQAQRRDYSLVVVDYVTNAPIADAEVTVSSEGRLYSTKTGTQGVANFSNLYLFPGSVFLISKSGYGISSATQQTVSQGIVRLWNDSDRTNEISGTLYIETDMTNSTPENVGANILITASTRVQLSGNNYYSVYFPAFTQANGTYSLKLPAAVNDYQINCQPIHTDQILYVNATYEDPVKTFPGSLPRKITSKTNFAVNSFTTSVPNISVPYYFKFAPDVNGQVLYIPGDQNSVQMSPSGDRFQISQLRATNVSNATIARYRYPPDQFVDVELVDISGELIEKAPKLSGHAVTSGHLSYISSNEGEGFVVFRRSSWGPAEPGSAGIITRAGYFNGTYYSWFIRQMNVEQSIYSNTTVSFRSNGAVRRMNFYYGRGVSRDVNVN